MGSPGDPQFENRWLDKEQLAGFQENMEASFYRLAAVTITLLEALEVGLGLPSGSLTSRVTNAASEFRLLHYPAVDVKTLRNGKINRIWPHFDLGVITLLFQDMSGGLEMQNRIKPQEFNAVVPSNSSEIVSNISETLQRWTNGELRAGLHQVTIPPCMKDKKSGIISDRYSIAFFCKADRHMSVGSLPFFISEACPAVYEDMSAIEYQQRRLQAAY
jgi:isopenicillin N synthase-like dioxygenase